ncbi:Glycine cleavage T-protein barrel domain protein, partial [Trichostrongylus colubriformis]
FQELTLLKVVSQRWKMGTPRSSLWPHDAVVERSNYPSYPAQPLERLNPRLPVDAVPVISGCLTFATEQRLTAREALRMPFFNQVQALFQMSKIIGLTHRSLLILRGSDSLNLLQGLVTNDVRTVPPSLGIAAFFLNLKGRIVDDVLISRDNGDILVECTASNRKSLKEMLIKYRMRKNVDIIDSHFNVLFTTDEVPNSFADPRCPSLGRRLYGVDGGSDVSEYHEKRRMLGIAEACEELGGLLPFHVNGDLLNMVSLEKGCYIGQELTARTAHTGVIRRRVLPFKCEKTVKGTVMQDDKKVGEIISCGNGYGLALIVLNAFGQPLSVGDSKIVVYKPPWMPNSALKPKER